MIKLISLLLTIYLLLTISSNAIDWKYLNESPGFKSSREHYPSSKVFVDPNSIKIINNEITSFQMKQVYSKPLKSGIKTFIAKGKLKCIKNLYSFNKAYGYDSNNNLIDSEVMEDKYRKIGPSNKYDGPIYYIRDYVCDIYLKRTDLPTVLDKQQEDIQKDLKELKSNYRPSKTDQVELNHFYKVLNEYIATIENSYFDSLSLIEKYELDKALDTNLFKSKDLMKKKVNDINDAITLLSILHENYLNKVKVSTFKEFLLQKKVNKELIENAINGYIEGNKASLKYIKDLFDTQTLLLTNIKILLNFLIDHTDKYNILDDKIYFLYQKDTDEYNKKITLIQELILKEEKMLSYTSEKLVNYKDMLLELSKTSKSNDKIIRQENKGLVVKSIDSQLVKKFNIESDYGVIITNVKVGTPAWAAGFKPGDIILQIDKTDISNISDYNNFINSVTPGKLSLILIKRYSSTRFLGYRF